jgi:nucleoid DNA-binding protein|tara:strand:+ start:2884 stop:3159 length:276 start_codon:yes stop_codon:yes gene_type:complete
MNFNKNNIIKKMSQKSLISKKEGLMLLDSFLILIKNKAQSKPVKLSGFGTFQIHKANERVGRNPKTKKTYIISSRTKIVLKSSNIVKRKLN